MERWEVFEALGRVGALITNSHVVYTSGKHGSAYVNKDALYPHTGLTSEACRAIAEMFAHYVIDAVVAPAVGGVILSQWIAYHLTDLTGREVLAVYAEKDDEEDDGFIIKRGYDKLITGKEVLAIEDILTTGGSLKKVIRAARTLDANIIGAGALCNRGGVTAEDLDVNELFSLVEADLEAWDEPVCPLCAAGVPINTDVGKGRQFLARQKA